VFAVGSDGALNIWWITDAQAWAARPIVQRRPLSHAGFLEPGSAVATGTQQSGHQVDAVVFAKDGGTRVASAVDFGAWVWADQ
jgi:hypothetical protein